MTDTPSLSTRLRRELTNNLTVSVVSILSALLGVFSLRLLLGDGDTAFTLTFFLLLIIAVDIPHIYESHWPVTYAPLAAAVWTVAAALITMGVFTGIYQLAGSTLQYQWAGAVALVLTVGVQYGVAIAFARAR